MFTITTMLDPLTRGETTKQYEWVQGKSLADYLNYDGKCFVSCGEDDIDLPPSEIFPARKERYVVVFIPEGMSRQDARVMGFMAMAGVRFIPGWGQYAAWAGSNIINLFLRDKMRDEAQSQSYSWRHVSSETAAFGSAMPIVYGTARVRPVVKNRYVKIDGDRQTLYALFGVTGRLVDEEEYERFHLTHSIGVFDVYSTYNKRDVVRTPLDTDEPGKTYRCMKDGTRGVAYTDTDNWEVWHGTASFHDNVYVNGRSISEYNADVRWETRPGLAEQALIDGFHVTYVNYTFDQELYRDFPEIDRSTNGINLRRSSTLGRIAYSVHDLWFRGAKYRIKKLDSENIGVGTIKYLLWDSQGSSDRYTISESPSTSDTVYTIAAVRISNKDKWWEGYPYYYGFETPPAETDWNTPLTSITTVHNIELTLEFPYGLHGLDSTASITAAEARIFAQYREVGTSQWRNFYSIKHFGMADAPIPYDGGELAAHVKMKRAEPFHVVLKAVEEDPDAYLYPSKEYEVRTVVSAPSPVKLINAAGMVYGKLNTDGTWEGFTCPGESLLGIKALASGQVNGELDVQVDVTRSKVWAWNPNLSAANKWQQVDANLHCWAVYDILVNGYYNTATALCHPAYPSPNVDGNTWTNETGTYTAKAEAIYGCGVNPTRIDFDSFNAWGTNINTIGYSLNTVFDSFMTAWDAILRICAEGRGMIYPIGGKIYAFTNKAEDVSQLFTMGNIDLDSFAQKYADASQQTNLVEADYFNADNNYEKTIVTARAADWDTYTGMSVPTKLTLYGTTNTAQALSIARFALRSAELLTNVISFGVSVDALASTVGNVVEVQHSVTDTTGQVGGRIVSSSHLPAPSDYDVVTLDQEVTLEVGVTYTVKVRHEDGTLEARNVWVVGVETTTATIGFSTDFNTLPEQYAPFTIYKASAPPDKYRIISISRSTELMRTLTLAQYDADLYDSTVPADSTPDTQPGEYTSPKIAVSTDEIDTAANLLNFASNLRLKQIISQNPTSSGDIIQVAATWDAVNADPRGSWEIWFRDVDVSDLRWYGEWSDEETYGYGDKVEHGGYTYISMVDDNDTEPITR